MEGSMELGMIGLGRMGANMTERLIRGGHRVIVNDIDSAAIRRLTDMGAFGAPSIESLIQQLRTPRAIWLIVPAGKIVEHTLTLFMALLQSHDIVIDGEN